jgi:hypothetical protein
MLPPHYQGFSYTSQALAVREDAEFSYDQTKIHGGQVSADSIICVEDY